MNDCGAMLNASTTHDWIHFPDIDGDGLYGNSVNCSWTIHALEKMTIEITVTIKYIECNYDYLMVSEFTTSLRYITLVKYDSATLVI